MDRPPNPRAWDTSDAALVAAIESESGHAVIAFKEPGSGRALKTGLRAAVTAGTVTAGLNLLRARGVQVVDLYDAIGAAHVIMNPSLAPALRASPLVDYIEPRQRGRIEGVPGTNILAFLPLGTAQSIPWGIQLVRAPDAWSITRGTGARIYLIDTGVDTTHEDLPHPPANHCGGGQGGCDDAYPVPHGTHVFGIWTARDNTVGVEGVAPGVNAADVYLWGGCDNSGSCFSTDVTNGLNAAVLNADVINLSLSFPFDAAMSNAVAFDWSNNIVLVAAAGNNGGNTIIYPANYTHVIGVSGVLPDKSFASTSPCSGASSNWGSHVDLAAPFYALSTVPGGYDDETGTPAWCGTSMATPHVSGVAALLRAQNPTWTNQQIVDRLTSTAQDLGAAGWDDHFGYGLVDAVKAVGALDAKISGPTTVFANQTQTWNSVVTGGVTPYAYQWYKDGSPVGTGASLTMNTGSTSFSLRLDVTDAASTTRSITQPITVTLPPPTSCTLEYIPQPHYLKVSWVNGDASASTEVQIMKSPFDWQLVGTDAPGVTQHFYVASSGLYYARVRHVKTGSTPSDYCNTNAKTVP
jgi:subtilisin family serine protease